MISTEEAEAMVDKKLKASTEPAQQEEPKEEVKPSETESKAGSEEPKEAEPKTQEAEEPKGEEAKEPEEQAEEPKDKPEKDETEDKRPPKQRYSHEERIAHQFAKEKQKRKEQREKYQKRIKELEDEIEKYKGLKLEDFGDNGTEKYLDYRLHERDLQNEVKNTRERMELEDAEDLRRETERRVNLSFDTVEERDEYNDLIATEGQKFLDALNEADPKGVVLDYLNGCEKYPLVLKKLMTDMNALAYVFRDKDPYELRHNLHQFTKELLDGKALPKEEPKQVSKALPVETKPEPVKPAIPVIGKQVTAQGTPSEPVHDRAYWNAYLKAHPMG